MHFKKRSIPAVKSIAKCTRQLKIARNVLSTLLILFLQSYTMSAQNPSGNVDVPDWALPGSATHKQVSPPADFHRATRTDNTMIGIFDGQSDVGAALAPGSSSYDKAARKYTVTSAGYNVWYTRDEFRYLWKKMSGDVSLATDVNFPNKAGYGDSKGFVIIRQNLDDDSKEVVVAIHWAGLLHLAWRADKGQMMQETRINHRGKGLPDLITGHVTRIGIEKHGNSFSLFVSVDGGAMQQLGDPIQLNFDAPFYVGIGFCSHLPTTTDTAIFSNLVLENSSGKVK